MAIFNSYITNYQRVCWNLFWSQVFIGESEVERHSVWLGNPGSWPAVLVLCGAFSSSHETSWNPIFSQSLGFFLLGAASPSLECLQLRMIPVISLSHACVDHWHWQSGQSNETFLLRPDPRWSMAVYRITGLYSQVKEGCYSPQGILGIPLNH